VLAVYAKERRSPRGAIPAAKNRAISRLIALFQKAEAQGGCLTTGDLRSTYATVTPLMGDVINALWPVSTAGITFTSPAGWHMDPGALALGGIISLDNFGSDYGQGGLLPANGAEIAVSSVPLPMTVLNEVIRLDRATTGIDSQTAVTVAGTSGVKVTYHWSGGQGTNPPNEMAEQMIMVYVPHAYRLYKILLHYNDGDPSESQFVAALNAFLESISFTP
jgi:hypothetical protein